MGLSIGRKIVAIAASVLMMQVTTAAAFAYPIQSNSREQLQKLEKEGWFDIKSVKVEKISQVDLPVEPRLYMTYANDCSSPSNVAVRNLSPITILPVNPNPTIPVPTTPVTPAKPAPITPGKPPASGGGSVLKLPAAPQLPGANPLAGVDEIVNLGEKVWSFIKENQPTVNTKTMSANALPGGVKCWDDLENWQPPRSETYRVTYVNGFGFEVVKLEFSLIYSYGGQLNGVGRFLTNATIAYKDLQVAWGGFHVDANVVVPMVTNIGTKQNPVAGLQISLQWSVAGLNHISQTASFFIYGDGRPSQAL